jgi:type IV secretory pathway TrbD component
LLDQAALLTAARRGGRRQERAEPLAAAEPDTVPAVGRAARRRLARMLGGEHPDLLAEWLAAVSGRGRRVPAQSLPALLHQGRRGSPAGSELRRLVAAAGGARARWLAGLNPEWAFVLSYAPAGEEAWRLGGAAQRRGYLSALRARDPGAARELVEESWDAAGPDERVMFLDALAAGLSLADEPLLEGALDDRQARVRREAADLLAALPGSALAGRMAERARDCLHRQRGMGRDGLLVSPPTGCDAAMRRDGITPSGAGGPPRAGRAMLLLDLLARTPLRTWTDRFGLTPAEIIGLDAGDWTPALFTGWSRAAVTQGDQEWMAALVTWILAGGLPVLAASSEPLHQLVRRVDPRPALLGPDANLLALTLPAVREAVGVLRFRYQMLKELDDDGAG